GATKADNPLNLRALVRDEGARAALAQLYGDSDQWQHLLTGVATGAPDWLRLANDLHAAADAGSAEQLKVAVGEALEHNPINVLQIALPVFGLSACGPPD